MSNIKVLITGTNGYIAQHVKRMLQQNGIYVDTLDVKDGSYENRSFIEYHTVIHLAGLVHKKEKKISWNEWERVNVNLTDKLLKKSVDDGVSYFIFMSTLAIYGTKPSRNLLAHHHIDDTTPCLPDTKYGKSKFLAEKKVAEYPELKTLIIRSPMVTGPNCPGNPELLRKIALALPVYPKIENQRSIVSIETLCEFIKICIQKEITGIYIPQESTYMSTVSLMQGFARQAGLKERPLSGLLAVILKVLAYGSKRVRRAFGSLTIDYKLSNIGTEYSRNRI